MALQPGIGVARRRTSTNSSKTASNKKKINRVSSTDIKTHSFEPVTPVSSNSPSTFASLSGQKPASLVMPARYHNIMDNSVKKSVEKGSKSPQVKIDDKHENNNMTPKRTMTPKKKNFSTAEKYTRMVTSSSNPKFSDAVDISKHGGSFEVLDPVSSPVGSESLNKSVPLLNAQMSSGHKTSSSNVSPISKAKDGIDNNEGPANVPQQNKSSSRSKARQMKEAKVLRTAWGVTVKGDLLTKNQKGWDNGLVLLGYLCFCIHAYL